MSNPLLVNNFTVNKLSVTLNNGKKVNVDSASIANVEYVESLMSKYLTVTVKLIDTTSMFSQALYGMEQVELVVTDNVNKVVYEFTKGSNNGPLYVYEIHDKEVIDKQKVFTLEMCRGDAIDNYSLRVTRAFKSVSATKLCNDVLAGVLKSKKTIKVDDSINKLSFVPPNSKPYDVLTWARNKYIGKDQKDQKTGGSYLSAGYFFYEDYYNYNFVSIDSLSKQSRVSYKFVTSNGTNSADEIYRLTSIKANGLNLFENFEKGFYSGRIDFFDIVNCEVIRKDYNIKDQYDKWNKLGNQDNLPKVYRDVLSKSSTRLMSVVYNDDLFLESDKLITKNRIAFEQIVSQSITRYGTFTSQVVTATAYGNLGLQVGNLVTIDFIDPDIKKDTTYSGKYIIFGIHHIFTKRGGEGKLQTKLTLVRDSFGA
jgi:hypothetical protein